MKPKFSNFKAVSVPCITHSVSTFQARPHKTNIAPVLERQNNPVTWCFFFPLHFSCSSTSSRSLYPFQPSSFSSYLCFPSLIKHKCIKLLRQLLSNKILLRDQIRFYHCLCHNFHCTFHPSSPILTHTIYHYCLLVCSVVFGSLVLKTNFLRLWA